jgi:hypothetical protein
MGKLDSTCTGFNLYSPTTNRKDEDESDGEGDDIQDNDDEKDDADAGDSPVCLKRSEPGMGGGGDDIAGALK